MKVLITGAAGFIGSHLVKAFHRRHQVTALVRQTSRREFLARYDIRFLEGDLCDREWVASAVGGFDLVIHAAAKAEDWGSYQEFFAANVAASLNLVESIGAATRLIFLSSIAVMGEEDCLSAKDETAPYNPVCPYPLESWLPSGMNHYRLTKTLAEQMLIRKAETRGIALTVLRPVWVFGPREFHAGPYEYCKTVQDGVPALPGSHRNRFHVIFVEDLARLVLRVAEGSPRGGESPAGAMDGAPPPEGSPRGGESPAGAMDGAPRREGQRQGIEIYNVGPSDVPLMDDFWGLFCRAMQRSKPMVFPPVLLYPLAILLEFLWTIAGAKTPPLLTRARLYLFAASNVVATQRVREAFGFHDFTPLPRAVEKTFRWWRRHKFLS